MNNVDARIPFCCNAQKRRVFFFSLGFCYGTAPLFRGYPDYTRPTFSLSACAIKIILKLSYSFILAMLLVYSPTVKLKRKLHQLWFVFIMKSLYLLFRRFSSTGSLIQISVPTEFFFPFFSHFWFPSFGWIYLCDRDYCCKSCSDKSAQRASRFCRCGYQGVELRTFINRALVTCRPTKAGRKHEHPRFSGFFSRL